MQFLAHWFLPHHTNNYRARVIHSSTLFFITIFIAVVSLLHIPNKVSNVLGYSANALPVDRIIAVTNQKRIESGLPALSVNSELAQAAHEKGLDMLAKGYWAHVAPDGTTPWDFFNRVGYHYQYAGENLARDFDSPEAVVNAWIASPSHRENLLSDKYHDIGIAVVEGDLAGKPTTLVVQMFGSVPQGVAVIQTSGAAQTNQENTFSTSPVAGRKIAVSGFDLQRTIALSVLGFLLVVFGIDAIVMFRTHVIRISGRTAAHLGFLASVVLIILLIENGVIL